MSKDLELLKTIDAYYPHPYRLLYMRCWGCGKRRIGGQWWEGYQVASTLPHGSTLRQWGHFCAECTGIIASMITDRIRFYRDTLRIETLDDALDQFTPDNLLRDPAASAAAKRIEALQRSIEADLQENGY